MNNMIFNLDLNKNNAINPIIFGRLTDGNLRKITVNITNEGEPVDLTGWVVRFEGTTGGQAKVFDVLGVQLLDAKNGKFEYTFSKTAFSATGAYRQAYFAIEKDNMRETTNDIKIVVENIADLDAQDAETVVTELNKTITLINQRYAELNNRVDIYEGDIASLEEWLLGKKNEIENIINSANSTFNQKLSEIQAKLDETNQAINNGDFYSKTETDQKLSAINTTITNHTSNKLNPHAVTANQIGAYSKTEADAKFATGQSLTDLSSIVVHNTGDEAIAGNKEFSDGFSTNDIKVTTISETVNIGNGLLLNFQRKGEFVLVRFSGTLSAINNGTYFPNVVPVKWRPDSIKELIGHFASGALAFHVDLETNGRVNWWGASGATGSPRGTAMYFLK